MTTATASVRKAGHAPLSHLTFGGLLRSEWIKLRSLRSTFWCYALIFLLNIGFAALISLQNFGGFDENGNSVPVPDDAAMSTATMAVTLGLNFTVLISAVLGALVITGEYGTGMIRSTFTADPKRSGAVFAKALVFGAFTFLIGLASMIIAALVSSALLPGSNDITIDWSDAGFWLALVGGAGYLALAGLVAFFLGAIIRAGAGGIAAGIGLIFVLPIVLNIFGSLANAKWASNVNTILPSNAGAVMFGYGAGKTEVVDGLLRVDQTLGTLIMVAWVVVTGILALILVKRRDV